MALIAIIFVNSKKKKQVKEGFCEFFFFFFASTKEPEFCFWIKEINSEQIKNLLVEAAAKSLGIVSWLSF